MIRLCVTGNFGLELCKSLPASFIDKKFVEIVKILNSDHKPSIHKIVQISH